MKKTKISEWQTVAKIAKERRTPLQKFIYAYCPMFDGVEPWRKMLSDVIETEKGHVKRRIAEGLPV